MSRIGQIARRHWAERRHYARLSDWALSIYNRALIHARPIPLPGRRRVRAVRLAGVDQPVLVRLATSDWYVMEEMFIDGEYEPLIRRNLTDVRTVLDLGANVGMSARLWQKLWPNAKIVAVEPDAGNLAMARRNVQTAHRESSAPEPAFVQACVAARPRTVHLDRSGGEFGFKMRDAGSSNGNGALANENDESVEALTVQQICDRGALHDAPIDLLKCDIEGAEAELFADCREWIGRVNHLVVELHDPYTPERFLADLDRSGVRFAVYDRVSKGTLHLMFLSRDGVPASSATAASTSIPAAAL